MHARGVLRRVAGGRDEAVQQPTWAANSAALYFVSDASGWWNLYAWHATGIDHVRHAAHGAPCHAMQRVYYNAERMLHACTRVRRTHVQARGSVMPRADGT